MEIFQQLSEFLDRTTAERKKPLVVVLGATAVGKTAMSLRIAKLFNGEIISADSRQIYKYMDIGTDKVTQAQQDGIPHHLIDELGPTRSSRLPILKDWPSNRSRKYSAAGTCRY